MAWSDFLAGDQVAGNDPLDILRSIAGAAPPQNMVGGAVAKIPNLPANAIPTKTLPPTPGPIENAVTPGGGADVRALLEQIGPLIASAALHQPGQRTGFLNGYMQGQQLGAAEREKKQAAAQAKNQAAANFKLEVGQHAMAIDDPVQRAQFIDLAENTGATAGLLKPGDLSSLRDVPASQVAQKRLKELVDQLGSLDKNGYNIDDLAKAGAHIRLKDGTDVPVSTAVDLTNARPLQAGGTVPVPKPGKVGNTEEERYVDKWAKEHGTTSDGMTSAQELEARAAFRGAGRAAPTGDDYTRFLTKYAKEQGTTVDKLTTKQEGEARAKWSSSTRDPILEAIRGLQLGAGGGAAGSNSVDASRPDPKSANTIDPRTGQTPNAVYQNGLAWAVTGTMTSQGMGNSPQARNARNAIQNKGAALAAEAGVDLPTLRAEYNAYRGTLGKLLPSATATAGFVGTATDNLDLALEQSQKVGRTGAQLVNRYSQWAAQQLTPATGLSELELYAYTAAREYAKVTSGGAMSSQGLTDSAAREASKLMSAAQAPETLAAVATGMKKDMANVVNNQTKQIAKVSTTIANFLKVTAGVDVNSDTTPAPAAATSSAGAPSYADYLKARGGK